ncbi:MAG: hypothetical protein NE334_01190 [Lentisphaeraceae bacterium]|nr:hypothetical protein [Lentisphaeraceae bacterium]
MKKLSFILFLIPLFIFAQSDNTALKSRIKLQIAEERIRLIKKDGDLTNLQDRILREYKKLDNFLKNHSEIKKNSKLANKELTALKLKLLEEDEDLRVLRMRILKLHRSLEDKLLKNKILKRLYSQLETLEKK